MNAKWITIPERPDKTALYIFQKTFTHQGAVESFLIEISADSRYQLYLNGRFLADGPCQGGEKVTYFETLDAADALVDGENVIEVRVMHYVGKQFLGVWRQDKPALFFYGNLDGREICSDESFACQRVKSLSFYNCDPVLTTVSPFEHMQAEQVTEDLETVVLYTPHYEDGFYSEGGEADRYRLAPRPLPLLFPSDPQALSVIEEFVDTEGNYNYVLDAGAYTTSMVRFALQARKDTRIRIYYAECKLLRTESGELKKGRRDAYDGVVEAPAFDTVTASGEMQEFEPFWYRAFRFIRVECQEKPAYFHAEHRRRNYPFTQQAKNGGVGRFSCDDPAYDDLWRVSVNTLECSAQETFMDCPYYEQVQYNMDGGLESQFAWRLSNDSTLQKQLIVTMAQSQEANGLVCASYPLGYRQIIPGFSLYYVMNVREYLRYTGDVAFARQYTGVCDRILEAFHNMLDDRGLVVCKTPWCYLDWVKTWTIGIPNGAQGAAMTAYNMMYAKALEDQAQVCLVCGRTGLAQEYRHRRAALIEAINKNCYDEEKQMYVDVAGLREYSAHTTVWGILSGCVAGEEARALMVRTMEDPEVAVCSFCMNYFLLRAMEKVGVYEKYAPRILDGWREMLDLGCTTWCESLAFPRSECHGWSSTPLYEMSAVLLGVYPTSDGFSRVRVKPIPLGLSHAEGRVPTTWGYIDVAWKREGEQFSLAVNASRETELELILPDGKTLQVTAACAELS